tara:strand:+ start:621 stop:737 length:117 start_codon:yes stop_codon:yes gene_type:complete
MRKGLTHQTGRGQRQNYPERSQIGPKLQTKKINATNQK